MLLRLSPLLLLSFLAGCTALPVQTESSVAAAEVLDTPQESVVRDMGWRPEDIPDVELSADYLLRFLAGDIAAQRGQLGFAAKSWLDLARRTRDPRIARRTVELALSSGQMALAQEAAQLWVETAPKSLMARQLLVSLLIRANRLSDVEAQIPSFLMASQEELADFYMQLHLLWDRKADPKQVARLTDLLTAGKDDLPEARFARATMHATQSRPDTALAELNVALKLRLWWEPAVMYKAQLLSQRIPPDAAVVFLRDAVNKNPMQQSYALALARLLTDLDRPEEARAAYATLLSQQPDQIEALIGAGLLALQARDFDEAYDRLLSALNTGPRNSDLLRYYLGQIDEARHLTSEALAWYQQVGGDELRKGQVRIPRLLAKLGEREAALKAVAALSAGSEQEKIENIQIEGQVWRELNEPATGYAVLSRGIAQFPEAVDLYYDRSLMADMMKNLAEAEADLRHVLSLQPENAMALNALGYMLANRTERLDEAEVLLAQALAREPDSPVIIDSLGWLRFRQGKLKEAVSLLKQAYELMPDSEIAAHYAEALWQNGDKNAARRILQDALKLDADAQILLETRQRLGF